MTSVSVALSKLLLSWTPLKLGNVVRIRQYLDFMKKKYQVVLVQYLSLILFELLWNLHWAISEYTTLSNAFHAILTYLRNEYILFHLYQLPRCCSSGFKRRVDAQVDTNVSEKHTVSTDFLRNVGIYLPVYTASRPRRTTSSPSPPWEHQISQSLPCSQGADQNVKSILFQKFIKNSKRH
jgi:hypothetical protein